jgi:hypothetical protein
MTRHFLALVLIALSSAAHAQHEDKKVLFQCDTTQSKFRVGLEAADLALGDELAETAPQALHFPGFKYTGRKTPDDNTLRSPGGTRNLHCGRLQIRLKSEYLNENPGGEMGVIAFGSIEVFSGTRHLLGPIGLAVCDLGFRAGAISANVLRAMQRRCS